MKKIISHLGISSIKTKGRRLQGKKAFSLIELIIVISIIAIISVSGLSSFSGFVDDIKLNNSISEISGDLDSLDNKVKKKEIFDYELYFSSGSLYYYNYENIFDLDVNLKLDTLDEITGIGKISFSGSSSGTGSIKLYGGYKFQKEEILDYNQSFTGVFNVSQNYNVTGSFSGEILNNINLKYFDREGFIKLVNINNGNNDVTDIKIKNILGKKIFGNDESINKITLTFENIDGNRKNLEISK